MPAAVFSLAFAAFAIGTTEFVIVGLLPDIARAFGISVSTAGLLVSFYALAITVGTPVVSALTARLPRRALLLALMTLFTLCNLAFNLGISGGSFLGGLTLASVNVLTTVYAGVALAVVGLVVVAMYRWSERPSAAPSQRSLGRC